MIGLQIEIPQKYQLAFSKKDTRSTLRSAGSEIAAVARRMVRRAVGTGRVYYGQGGRHVASAPGEPPVSWSGDLANSIKVRPLKAGDGVLVKDTMFYSLFLEVGAKGGISSGKKGVKGKRNPRKRRGSLVTPQPVGSRVLEPRPFLSVAAQQREESIGQRVKAAIINDIKFRRISAAAKI